ncbi:MAG: AraC family transcriptional regulator [Bacteroidota bacterium]|nr:AraC family transcriptional regulator [Odoribacter sp.]MDP3642391.1 AraC family transcriptional regulator [Bacteroidota bacterium]
MDLHIKNMVSYRCKLIVKSELEKLGVQYKSINLGKVEIIEDISVELRDLLNFNLKKSGLALIEDKKIILVEKIKNIIIELVHYTERKLKINLSDYLSQKLNYDYTYLANLFSENQGNTIEHFFLNHKIERAKELLVYDELNISEIADKLHYSSVAHLSNQFKKITGLTPSDYKHLRVKMRKPIEKV